MGNHDLQIAEVAGRVEIDDLPRQFIVVLFDALFFETVRLTEISPNVKVPSNSAARRSSLSSHLALPVRVARVIASAFAVVDSFGCRNADRHAGINLSG